MTVTYPTAAREERVALMGVEIDRLNESETIAVALDRLREDVGGWICPTNLDVLRQCVESEEIRELVRTADVVVADGMPLVWASRLAGRPLPGRVAGSSLIETLPREAAAAGATVFLLGGNPGAAEQAAERLRASTPDLQITGVLCPPMGFERDAAELAAIEAALRHARPDIVFVGLGFPKQERLIERLRPVLPQAWFVSCGISFSFVSGEVARAPRWIQRAGLEWLHRLAQEPRRLFRRYVVQGLPFLAQVGAQALASRLRAAQPASSRYRA
jgi:N-acetylglucosaminyldiphosphoundecaprenol N-acetyl-beta-D-mannosaminyltransferase